MKPGDILNFYFVFFGLPVVHEALEEFGGPELVHLSDHTDAHVSVPTEQPGHMFMVSWKKNEKVSSLQIYFHLSSSFW